MILSPMRNRITSHCFSINLTRDSPRRLRRDLSFQFHSHVNTHRSRRFVHDEAKAPGTKYRIMGTWLTPTPNKISSEEVISQFPMLEYKKCRGMLTAVFFVTPSFASWLDEGQSFLRDATHRIWRRFPVLDDHDRQRELRTVAVVVDRLPGPPKLDADGNGSQSLGHAKPLGAFEGVGLYIHADQSPAFDVVPSGGSFELSTNVRFRWPYQLARSASAATQNDLSLTLPTANTLFVNGRRTTMFLDIWQSEKTLDDSSLEIKHVQRQSLRSVDLRLPRLHKQPFDVSIPLEQLTAAREIVSSMGNILRQLGGDNGTESIPASAELEKLVPQLLESKRKEGFDGIFQIFALIQAPRRERTIGPHSLITASNMGSAIMKGARLHRVTSGGGGWGKKQGLLSLEPAIDFGTQAAMSSAPFLDPEPTQDNAGSGLLPPGHTVQFFASFAHPPGPKMVNLQEGINVSEWWTKDWKTLPQLHVSLGVIPSSEEFSSDERPTEGDESRIACHPGFFGMLSESGACLETFRSSASVETADMDEEKPFFQSRMDVPYAAVNIMVPNGLPEKRGVKLVPTEPKVKTKKIPFLRFTRKSEDGNMVRRADKPYGSMGKGVAK